ncbi:MAG: RNA-binding protein [Flavobacteriales bacterium]|nr:RNA-binding protein [Flavobacteriales bacterium]MCB9193038.1 RNA-binding protein [Flavobacteriales bacterium]
MPKPKRPRDVNQRAKSIVAIATGETEDVTPKDDKDPAAVALGRKGGAARAKSLSAAKRKAIAKKAASKRWAKRK